VWPDGAVSTTMREYVPAPSSSLNSKSAITSSSPGKERSSNSLMSLVSSNVPRSAISPRVARCFVLNFSSATPASISYAMRRAPLCFATSVRWFPIFTSRLSERECAGSVEKRRICSSVCAESRRARAVAAAAVVLPTPPLPPKKR
jgi:hypothetical protein